MNSEKTGGAFLLQEQEPKRLIGVFVSTTTEQFPGWIWGAFGDEDPRSKSAVVTEVALSRNVALPMASLLQVLVAQNACMRGETIDLKFDADKITTFSVRMENGPSGMVYLAWAAGEEGIVWNEQPGEIEWGLREDRALDLSHAIIVGFAKTASGACVPSSSSLPNA